MKRFKLGWVLAGFLAVSFPTSVYSSASRVLDGADITNGAALLVLPTTSDTMVGRVTTDTLQNKSISGSQNTFSNIPASAVSSGQLAVANGGTGLATVATNGILYGQGSSPLAVASAGSQYQTFQAGASGVPAFGALHLDQSAAVTGALAIANGGTGQTTAANAINALVPTQTGNNGKFLKTDGSVVSWASVPSPAPTLNGSAGSPQSVVAASGISLTSPTYSNIVWVVGDSAAPADVSATPSITAGTDVGDQLIVIGTDNTATVTLRDEASVAGSTLQLNGPWVGAKYSVLLLVWDGTFWNEISRR